MSILVVRHALSEVNTGRFEDAYGAFKAPLELEGWAQAHWAGLKLAEECDVMAEEIPVAVSKMTRAHQTARGMGFQDLRKYWQLNEVNVRKRDVAVLKRRLNDNDIPKFVMKAAERVVKDPPKEKVWVTHGALIAGLCKLYGVYEERLKPGFTEIRELPIELNNADVCYTGR